MCVPRKALIHVSTQGPLHCQQNDQLAGHLRCVTQTSWSSASRKTIGEVPSCMAGLNSRKVGT